MTQSWPTQQALGGNQTLFPNDAKLPSTQQNQSKFSPLHLMSGFFGKSSLLICVLLPGVSPDSSCRSGRSSAANAPPPSPGTSEVVSLARGKHDLPEVAKSPPPLRDTGGQYIRRAVCVLHGNFSKISGGSQGDRCNHCGERYWNMQRERESVLQAVRHRVRSEVRKHL